MLPRFTQVRTNHRNMKLLTWALYLFILVLCFLQVEFVSIPWLFPNSVPDMYAHLSDMYIVTNAGHVILATPNSNLQYPGAYLLGSQFQVITNLPLLAGYTALGLVILFARFALLFLLFRSVLGRSVSSLLALGFAVITDLLFVTYFGSESLSIPLLYLVAFGLFRNDSKLVVLPLAAQVLTDPLFYISDMFLLLTVLALSSLRLTREFRVPLRLVIFAFTLMIAYFAFTGWIAVVGIAEAAPASINNLIGLLLHYVSSSFVPTVHSTSLASQLALIGNQLHRYVDYTVGAMFVVYILFQISGIARKPGTNLSKGALMSICFVSAGAYFLFSPTGVGLYAPGNFLEVSYPMMVLASALLLVQANQQFAGNSFAVVLSQLVHRKKISQVDRALKYKPKRDKLMALTVTLIIIALWAPYFSIRITYQDNIGTGPIELSGSAFLNHRMPAGTVFTYQSRLFNAYSYISHTPWQLLGKSTNIQGQTVIDAYIWPPSNAQGYPDNLDTIYATAQDNHNGMIIALSQ
jgi:hypothetical protein